MRQSKKALVISKWGIFLQVNEKNRQNYYKVRWFLQGKI